MNKTTKDKLDNIVKGVLGVEVTDDLRMDTVSEWDSLRHIQLMAKIEKEFKIDIDFKDTLSMTSVQSITDVLEKYIDEK